MALSPATPRTVRSISLPSRSHPLNAIVEENLQRLKASSEAASSSSASSICLNLCGLRDLYESVNDFLQLPLTQQSLSHEQDGKWAEKVLDGSLRLLDVCGNIRDVLVQMKESIQELQSSIRRKRSADSGIADEVPAYMNLRKKINKMVPKCILNLKSSDKDNSLDPIIGMFREVEAVNVSVLRSLLSYVSGTKPTSKQSQWKLVSKIMQKKRGTCGIEEVAEINEIEMLDGALYASSTQKSKNKAVLAQNALKQLVAVDMALHELEVGLEPIFRCLLKTRVNLLNAMNH